MTALEILKGAREFLSDPTHWRQGGFVKYTDTSNGLAIEGICSVCLDGALYYAAGLIPGIADAMFPPGALKPFQAAQWRVANAIHFGTVNRTATIWPFNDTDGRQHSEILSVLNKAIAAEETAQ